MECPLEPNFPSPLISVFAYHNKEFTSFVVQGEKSDGGLVITHEFHFDSLMKIITSGFPRLKTLSFKKLQVPVKALEILMRNRKSTKLRALCFHEVVISAETTAARSQNTMNLTFPSEMLLFNSSVINGMVFPKMMLAEVEKLVITLTSLSEIAKALTACRDLFRESRVKSIHLVLNLNAFMPDAVSSIGDILSVCTEKLEALTFSFHYIPEDSQEILKLFDVIRDIRTCRSMKKFVICGQKSILKDDSFAHLMDWLSTCNDLTEICLGGLSEVTDFAPLSSISKVKKLAIYGAQQLSGSWLAHFVANSVTLNQLYLRNCAEVRPEVVLHLLATCKNLVAFEVRDCGRYSVKFFERLVSMKIGDHLKFLNFVYFAEMTSTLLHKLKEKFASVSYRHRIRCRIDVKNDAEWFRIRSVSPKLLACSSCGGL
ncbi:unnamed protein product [Soboliphyme baturini]|uniref:F-box domain-containing protein n=1 Tax=Soboliphyme baturini TaxID=241478 RepID=A0A183J157_9BILA|nr:unnamed protein product [Soboliphyme baturini]